MAGREPKGQENVPDIQEALSLVSGMIWDPQHPLVIGLVFLSPSGETPHPQDKTVCRYCASLIHKRRNPVSKTPPTYRVSRAQALAAQGVSQASWRLFPCVCPEELTWKFFTLMSIQHWYVYNNDRVWGFSHEGVSLFNTLLLDCLLGHSVSWCTECKSVCPVMNIAIIPDLFHRVKFCS